MNKLLVIAMLLLTITACSPKIDPIEQGKIIFNKKHLGKNKVIGCVLCHSTKVGEVIVGPSLAGLSIRAPHLVSGESAQEYIKNAIVNPDAYVVEGYLPATMFSHYQQELTGKEIGYLIRYLSQL